MGARVYQTRSPLLEDKELGGKEGGDAERALKKVLVRFHIFLKLLMLETPISFLRKLLSFQKCIQQTGPTD